MTDFNYKNYSLEKLEEWVHDALSCGDASPHEIYSVIRKVVQDEYNYHKEQSQKCFGLLELLSGHRPVKPVDVSVIVRTRLPVLNLNPGNAGTWNTPASVPVSSTIKFPNE